MHRSSSKRGLLIAIEGIDGSGTSTQAELLVRRLNQHDSGGETTAHLTREPSNGVIGRLLRHVLAGEHDFSSHTIALLFAADRLEHYRSEIRPVTDRGTHVVSDRFVFSSLAYQSVYDSADWVFQINAHAPSPDLTVYLRVDPQTAALRRAARGTADEIFDADALQRQIAQRYDALLGSDAEQTSWRIDAHGMWKQDGPARTAFGRSAESAMIDGEQTVETIHRLLWTLVETKMRQDTAAKGNKSP